MRQHFQKPNDTVAARASTPPTASNVPNVAFDQVLVCKPTLVEPWRVFRIMAEFVDGFDLLKKYGLAATIFGSTRANPDSPLYGEAEELAARLSKSGFTIITGGATGIMEAANKGAYRSGGASVGLNIQLPHEQHYNNYLTDQHNFHHFYVRKVMLSFASEVYIYFPGGFGTLDEFFEIITLIQTKKIKRIPVILVGREYWTPLLAFIEKMIYTRYVYIDEADMQLYHLVDSVEDAHALAVQLAHC
jgi:uncharacterized protein (TIGR00730 family)